MVIRVVMPPFQLEDANGFLLSQQSSARASSSGMESRDMSCPAAAPGSLPSPARLASSAQEIHLEEADPLQLGHRVLRRDIAFALAPLRVARGTCATSGSREMTTPAACVEECRASPSTFRAVSTNSRT
jgi:hypothetical protein